MGPILLAGEIYWVPPGKHLEGSRGRVSRRQVWPRQPHLGAQTPSLSPGGPLSRPASPRFHNRRMRLWIAFLSLIRVRMPSSGGFTAQRVASVRAARPLPWSVEDRLAVPLPSQFSLRGSCHSWTVIRSAGLMWQNACCRGKRYLCFYEWAPS